MNNIILTGNLTKDLELRYIPESQKAVATSTLAVKRLHTKDKTDFIPVVFFGKTAENAEKFLHKGSKILIVGTLAIDSYEKDGERKTYAKVNCNTFEFLDNKEKNEQKQQDMPEGFIEDSGFAALDDDIPF